MAVFTKLVKARKLLQNKNIKQSGKNDFSKYSYYELKDFLPHINLLFEEIGLCGIVSFTDELATLTIHDIEDSTSVIFTSPMSSANLKGCHPVQNIGAVETYQRRYLYMTALEIVESDVLDKTTTEQPTEEVDPKKRDALIKSVEESAIKGSKAMGEYWTALPIEDQRLIGTAEKKRIYQIAQEHDNGTTK